MAAWLYYDEMNLLRVEVFLMRVHFRARADVDRGTCSERDLCSQRNAAMKPALDVTFCRCYSPLRLQEGRPSATVSLNVGRHAGADATAALRV